MRRKYCDKELDDLQRYKQENKNLKKQVKSLRKQLARININKYEEDDSKERLAEEERNKRIKWQCNDCEEDYLRLILIDRADGLFYFRRCPTCGNRTKSKKYDKNVEGLS